MNWINGSGQGTILCETGGCAYNPCSSLGVITRLKDNKEYKYQGNILNVYDNGFYTIYDNRLIQYKSDF